MLKHFIRFQRRVWQVRVWSLSHSEDSHIKKSTIGAHLKAHIIILTKIATIRGFFRAKEERNAYL